MSDLDPTEINALAILGADPDVRELASLERLRLAARVAQAERNMSEKARARRWTKDSGGTITHGELIGELNAAQKIEIDVAPLPVREQARVMARQGMSIKAIIEALGLQGIDAPSETTLRKMVRDINRGRRRRCEGCGVEILWKRVGGVPKRCGTCARPMCGCGCGARAPATAMSPKATARRRGAPWRCRSQAQGERYAAMTAEQKAKRASAALAALALARKAKMPFRGVIMDRDAHDEERAKLDVELAEAERKYVGIRQRIAEHDRAVVG